jgi:hypothetical protein
MNMGMLDRYLLLALAALTIERVEQHGLSPGKLVGLAQVFASPLKRLLAKSFFSLSGWNFPGSEELSPLQQLKTEAPMVAKTVLVVEDDPSIRVVAEEMFVLPALTSKACRGPIALSISSRNAPNKLPFCSPMSRLPARLTGSILQGW